MRTNCFEEPAREILSQMTLDEKIMQVRSLTGGGVGLRWGVSVVEKGIPEELDTALVQGLGNLHAVCIGIKPSEQAESINRIQKRAIEGSRLGIPLLLHTESLHGFRTMFPQAIALASTWDPDLVREIFTAVALEIRSCGYHITYAPVLDLATDPRWGRCQETYGEDPYLVSRLAVAAVEGYQGGAHPETIDDEHVIAVAKHFAGYGQSDGGRNFAPVNIGPRRFHDEILAPFRAAVTEAGLLGIMPAHHEVDGVPCHANDELLRKTLREAWGFDGILVSDADDIRRLNILHGVAADELEAVAQGLQHRIAVDILSCRGFARLHEVLERFPDVEPALDRIVLDTLIAKFRLGLFDNPYVEPARADRVCHGERHISLARKSARKCAVLLKNESGQLPLRADAIQTLAVIGPNSDEIQCGTYGANTGTNILDGLRAYAEGRFDVVHAKGCHITRNTVQEFLLEDDDRNIEDNPILVTDAENQALIDEAATVAARADVVVLVMGGNNFTGREAFFADDHRGDRDDLSLPGSQLRLLEAVAATDTPVVLILNHGNALLLKDVLPRVEAVLEIWYAGEETGPAVAELLFGDVTPGGKLPVTFPYSTGSVPCPYNQKPSGTLKAPLFSEQTPALPYGYGLSTTNFEISAPVLSSTVVKEGESLDVNVTVTNTGDVDGDEVVQVYLRDPVASVTRPARQLAGFRRVHLKPGESREVSISVTADRLAFTRADMTFGPEPGRFVLYVGTDSRAEASVEFELVG